MTPTEAARALVAAYARIRVNPAALANLDRPQSRAREMAAASGAAFGALGHMADSGDPNLADATDAALQASDVLDPIVAKLQAGTPISAEENATFWRALMVVQRATAAASNLGVHPIQRRPRQGPRTAPAVVPAPEAPAAAPFAAGGGLGLVLVGLGLLWAMRRRKGRA